MATRITIDRKLPIKASANPQIFSCRREILGSGIHPRKPVFNSSHRGVGLPPKKSLRQVFVNSLSVFFNLVQHSSTFKEYLQYSGRFLQPIVSIFLRRIEWSSCSPKTNFIHTPQVRRNLIFAPML